MFYNRAMFMGIPWDTLIKTFRGNLPKQGYDKLDDYVSAFIEFLEKNNPFITVDLQREFLGNIAYGYFLGITEDIENIINSKINENGPIDNKTIESIALQVINEHADRWLKPKGSLKGSYTRNISRKIITKNKDIIDSAIKTAFENIPIAKGRNRLFEIIESLLYIGSNEQINSGVVIAGFGEREAFPTLVHMVVEGLFDNKLKHGPISRRTIGEDVEATLAAYAQGEMVQRFMEGIDPFYKEIQEGYLSQLPEKFANHLVRKLNKYNKSEKEKIKNRLFTECKRIIDDFNKNMLKIGEEKFIGPITDVVSVLPKSDLATLAESLVSLTVVKRKFSTESETVAEPIDVALISKGDGFIWIKRKHYFNPEYNPGFFTRRYKE